MAWARETLVLKIHIRARAVKVAAGIIQIPLPSTVVTRATGMTPGMLVLLVETTMAMMVAMVIPIPSAVTMTPRIRKINSISMLGIIHPPSSMDLKKRSMPCSLHLAIHHHHHHHHLLQATYLTSLLPVLLRL
jgi:hypothetical protein